MIEFVLKFAPIALSVGSGLFIADQIKENDKWWGVAMLAVALLIECFN